MTSNSTKPVSFIAYIDEAGDDGIRKVSPIDPMGSSEWFVLAAVVVGAHREAEVLPWVKAIVSNLKQHQRKDIHYRNLSQHKRVMVCELISDLPIRCFVAISNKKNMRGYRNLRAEKIPSKNWFYCWMLRLLLERVTDFCERKAAIATPPNGILKIEFSKRGGLSYSQFKAYLAYLRQKSHANRLYLDTGDIKWPYIDEHRIHTYDHRSRAGLQLADAVASAFYQAAQSNTRTNDDIEPAIALAPRVGFDRKGIAYDYGVKLMPALHRAALSHEQRRIFDFYRKKRQAPGPNNTAGNTSPPSKR